MDPTVCFQSNILPIFVSNCAMSGCHDGQGRVKYNLTTYEGIMAGVVPGHPLRSKMYTSIKSTFGGSPSMPRRAPPLSDKDILLIQAWISMGAKNTSNCVSCDTNSFSFSGTVNPILNTWCVGCHNTNSAGGGFDLSNYNGVVRAIAHNKLLGSIEGLPGYYSMPQSGNRLSDCEISQLKKWVNAGYPNN